MTDINFEISAELRSDAGKGASRRLRREKKVPAILYGGDKDPVQLTLTHSELDQNLQYEAFYSHILTVKYDGKSEKAILRDMQRHPSKPFVMHVDLQRVSQRQVLKMSVPLHFLNEETAPGIKQEGGVVAHLMTEVEISCMAKDLPEYLEVDVGELSAGDSVHLSQIKLPEGVEIVALTHGEEYDQAVASIHVPRGAMGAEEEEGAEEGGEAAGEAGSEEEEGA